LRFEEVKRQPLAAEAGGEVADGLGLVECVQSKVGLRELLLAQARSKDVDGVVAARDVLSEAELGQQHGSGERCAGLGLERTGAGNGRIGALAQGLLDGQPECERLWRLSTGRSGAPRGGGSNESGQREDERAGQSRTPPRAGETRCPCDVHATH
jgi:hypothetical protein